MIYSFEYFYHNDTDRIKERRVEEHMSIEGEGEGECECARSEAKENCITKTRRGEITIVVRHEGTTTNRSETLSNVLCLQLNKRCDQ